jgi:hypothetical protein
MPRDGSDYPIQVLAPEDATSVNGTSSGTSVSLALPAGAKIVEVAASDGIHWTFGDSNDTATTSNKFQGAGTLPYRVPEGVTHLAFIASTGVSSAICSVTKLI